VPLVMELGLGPGHIVLDDEPVGTQRPHSNPSQFSAHVSKGSPISATAELLFRAAATRTEI